MTHAASISAAGWISPAVIGLDLVVLLAMGLYFSRRQTTTESYFVARRSVPEWAMVISLIATIITSVTFVAYPGAAQPPRLCLRRFRRGTLCSPV